MQNGHAKTSEHDKNATITYHNYAVETPERRQPCTYIRVKQQTPSSSLR